MADIIRYIDTGVVGGDADGTSWEDAYSSINDWNSTEATNLVSDGNTHTVYCKASTGVADLIDPYFEISSPWHASDTYSLTIKAAVGHEAVIEGYKTDRYRIEYNSGSPTGAVIKITVAQIIIDGLQILNKTHSTAYTIHLNSFLMVTDTHIKNCRIGSDQNTALLFASDDTDIVAYIDNCIFDNGRWGIRAIGRGSITVYNSIFANISDDGIYATYNGVNMVTKNCAFPGVVDDLNSIRFYFDYCAHKLAGDGTNHTLIPSDEWGLEFVDYLNGDFTLLETSRLINKGIGPNLDGEVPVLDIEGKSRVGDTCDIGIHVFVPPVSVDVDVNLITGVAILFPSIEIYTATQVRVPLTTINLLSIDPNVGDKEFDLIEFTGEIEDITVVEGKDNYSDLMKEEGSFSASAEITTINYNDLMKE